MSNRRKPRNVQRQQYVLGAPALVEAFATAWRCPDCDSHSSGIQTDKHGMQHLTIEHDDGCPYLAGVTR